MKGSTPINRPAMKYKRENGFQKVIRCFLLISVLTAIFFSNSEGVHLLPFPISSASSENDICLYKQGIYKSYTYSTHNRNTFSALSKGKLKKNIEQNLVSSNCYTTFSDDPDFFFTSLNKSYIETKHFYSFIFFISPSDRAPPTV